MNKFRSVVSPIYTDRFASVGNIRASTFLFPRGFTQRLLRDAYKTTRMIIDGWIKQYDKYWAFDRSSRTNESAPDSVQEASAYKYFYFTRRIAVSFC